MPFYIGKGVRGRAWAIHYNGDGMDLRPALCQRVRKSAKQFRVEIIEDHLTESEAFVVEAAFVKFLNKKGFRLTNQTG